MVSIGLCIPPRYRAKLSTGTARLGPLRYGCFCQNLCDYERPYCPHVEVDLTHEQPGEDLVPATDEVVTFLEKMSARFHRLEVERCLAESSRNLRAVESRCGSH